MPINQQAVLESARASPHYLGHPNVAARATWVTSAVGDVEYPTPTSNFPQATTTTPHPLTVYSLIGQIKPRGFFAEPDMGFDPNRLAPWQVGYCRLI
jgi:hypothetical protein